MGGCVSVQVSCDQVFNHLGSCFCRKVKYIHNLIRKVQTAEEGGQQRLHQIKVWLKRVKFVESQFNDLSCSTTVELQRLCFYGTGSKNLRLSYSYGKRVVLMLNEVQDLKSKGVFEEVAHPAMRAVGEERPLQLMIVGQETTLEKAWTRLMDDQTKIMGLYGMGGEGKTTLLTQINNRFCDTDDGVEIVIWVVVSCDLQIHKIQKEIGEKIGFKDVEWNKKSENQKAVDILNFLSKKRFVLLLDDILERVDLTKIGIPNPTNENGCKIAFTTRSLCVCSSMGVHDRIEVRCLGTDDAWNLFRKKVGEIALGKHPDIPEIARKVARACRGLPLALNVIGETMACKKTT